MVKKFTLNCKVGGQNSLIDFFVGDPNENSHPIGFQMKFMSQMGVTVPEDAINSISKINEIAKRNRIPFEDLLEFVNNELNQEDHFKEAFDKASEFSKNNNKNNK